MTCGQRQPRKAPAGPGPTPVPRSGRLLGILIAAWVAFVASPPTLAAGSGRVPEGNIAAIRIEGNTSIVEDQVLPKLLSRAGRPLDPRTIDADIKSLYGTHWFSYADAVTQKDPGGRGYVLIFRVQEMPILTSVEFRGRQHIKLKELEDLTGLKIGNRADATRARLAVQQIQRLYHEKGYELAETELLEGGKTEDRRVVIQIFEGPKFHVRNVTFEGNTFASDGQLLSKLAGFMIAPIEWVKQTNRNPEKLADDVRKLTEYYRDHGYFEARVTPVLRPTKVLGTRTLCFVIHEGPQYKVREIRFDGNQRLNVDQLKTGLAMHDGQPYSNTLREADRKAILSKYSDIGCIFTMVDPEPRFVDPRNGIVDLVYKIEESPPIILGQLIVKGNASTRDKVIRREAVMAGLLPGELLNANRIETFKTRLGNTGYFTPMGDNTKPPIDVKIVNQRPGSSPYGEGIASDLQGLVLTRLQGPESDPTPLPGLEDLGPPPSGPPPLPSATPSEPSPFGSGELFNPPPDTLPPIVVPPTPPDSAPLGPLPPAGRQPLTPAVPTAPDQPKVPVGAGEPSGMFPNLPGSNMLETGPDRQDPFRGSSYADLIASVEEGPTGRIMLGVGATSYGGINGNFVIHERNFDIFNIPRSPDELFSGRAFRGGGQELRIELSPGTLINRFMVSFREPYLFDQPIGFAMSGYAFQRYYNDYTEDRGGGRFSLGKQLGTSTYLDVAFRIEDVNVHGFRYPSPAEFLAASGHTTLASIRPSLRFDNRNNPMAPSKGQYLEMGFEQGWGTFTFPVATVEGRQYFTLWSRPDGTGKHILTARGFFGIAGRDTPVYERFYAGNIRSLRGFAFRGVGPHVLGSNVGGIMSALGSIEYQFPWTANDRFQQVVFCDFGTVESDYSFTTLRASVGTGLRVTVPGLGPLPLAFDLAFPVSKGDDDRTQYFNFSIGAMW